MTDQASKPVPPAAEQATQKRDGAHAARDGEQITSRSADPGQSSYGGFHNEDPSRQAQDIDRGAKDQK